MDVSTTLEGVITVRGVDVFSQRTVYKEKRNLIHTIVVGIKFLRKYKNSYIKALLTIFILSKVDLRSIA